MHIRVVIPNRTKRAQLVVLIIAMIATIMMASAIRILKLNDKVGINEQIVELNKVSDSLKSLTVFVENQKMSILRQEEAVKALSAEKSRLEPVVHAQREVVEALFRLQEDRAAHNKWFDRGTGFVLGVLGSMVGSIVLGLVKRTSNAA